MQEVYIPHERVKQFREKEVLGRIEKTTNCKIVVESGESISVDGNGDVYREFLAKNIIMAFGRGFDIDTSCLLANEDYYFKYIDLKEELGSDKRIRQVEGRVVGREGKTKRYIESVSSVKMSIFGNTIGFIGRIDEIDEAEIAVKTLIEGGTHRVAYTKMEEYHRKNKRSSEDASF